MRTDDDTILANGLGNRMLVNRLRVWNPRESQAKRKSLAGALDFFSAPAIRYSSASYAPIVYVKLPIPSSPSTFGGSPLCCDRIPLQASPRTVIAGFE